MLANREKISFKTNLLNLKAEKQVNSISRSLLKDNIRNALAFRLVAGCRNIDSLLTIQPCNKLQLFIHTFYLFQPPAPKRHPLLCGEIIFT